MRRMVLVGLTLVGLGLGSALAQAQNARQVQGSVNLYAQNL
jgi:hypothetical protein